MTLTGYVNLPPYGAINQVKVKIYIFEFIKKAKDSKEPVSVVTLPLL